MTGVAFDAGVATSGVKMSRAETLRDIGTGRAAERAQGASREGAEGRRTW